MSTAITVMAFTVVLAEVFVAVGLSTLAPATFVQLCRAARALLAGATDDESDAILMQLMKVAPPMPGLPPVPSDPGNSAEVAKYNEAIKPYKAALKELVKSSDKLQLLVPTTASIDAEFSCGGSESYSSNFGVEGVIQVVGIKAGFSSLFELHSSTTVRLHVEFGTVEYDL